MMNDQTLRIVVFKSDDMFVAQCLEHDICTQAKDFDTLKERMDCLIGLELECSQDIDAAPERFHKMWDQSVQMAGSHEYRMAA
jgi:hypothetical protein